MSVQLPESYRAWLEESISPVVRGWCPDVVRRRCEQATEEYLRRTTDDAASRGYAEACPVAGVDHTLYRLRELALPNGIRLLAGVHFRGHSSDYPFVGVFAQSRWLTPSETAAAHAALLSEFSVFRPRATWWWVPLGKDLPTLAGVTPDQHLVMGSLEEIRKLPATPLPSAWVLRRLESATEIRSAFAGLYQSFHRARPDLEELVPVTQLEALVDCAAAGGLYGCFAEDELVGVLAVKPEAQYSVDAWLMWDILLARPYCGKGLAPILQRTVLDRLDVGRAPLVVGTINSRNLPSLRTALRVGRQIVGTWYFISG